MSLLFSIRVAERPSVWEELFILFTVLVFRERLSICVSTSFPAGFKGDVRDLTVTIPDHCVSFTFKDFAPKDENSFLCEVSSPRAPALRRLMQRELSDDNGACRVVITK